MFNLDPLLITLDNALRTLFAPAPSARKRPGSDLPEAPLSDDERRRVVGLLRVDHAGEICAQALYQGQALTARHPAIQATLRKAAQEETEHLAWTEARLAELGGRTSVLNPVWYAGSLAIGAVAGLLGDRWNLGFLAETERQVEGHLDGHLERLPKQDRKSRAILLQMKIDEARHASTALYHGGAELPAPVRLAMRVTSRVMTSTAYWV
ncbi:2-polyprenyl-3-methyl-6-methoxy-1,4-benzoquinone monooxygenase [Pelomicrobium sp. G1]|uniref:2-polyprenyl-3-methyl-6-methoxy-1,4-benzoquinone monooxygenase n=1 Tax=unclassified Pelomicrobium TaxID=2815318 RepID=UPI003F775FF4